MSPGRWIRRLAPPLLATLLCLVVGAGPVAAGYQGTVAVNITKFQAVCDGDNNPLPARMEAAALSAYRSLGYSTLAIDEETFTRPEFFKRTPSDWGFYVHSHGERARLVDGTYDYAFMADYGDCRIAWIGAKEIKAKRAGRPSNLVIISTCFNGSVNSTMPLAFGIARSKYRAEVTEPEFYLGYLGEAWDSDEAKFEQRFFDAVLGSAPVGQAFDIAMAGGGFHSDFDADWWGAYYWSGIAGPIPPGTCTRCV